MRTIDHSTEKLLRECARQYFLDFRPCKLYAYDPASPRDLLYLRETLGENLMLLTEAQPRQAPQKSKGGGVLSTIGHLGLDVAGVAGDVLFGAGAAADITNAAWYAAEGEYLNAVFSLISTVPVVGDAIGKSGKVISWLSKTGKLAPLLKKAGGWAVKICKKILENEAKIRKVIEQAKKVKKLRKYSDKMLGVYDQFMSTVKSAMPKDGTASQKPQQQNRPTSNKPGQQPAAQTQKKALPAQKQKVNTAPKQKQPAVQPT